MAANQEILTQRGFSLRGSVANRLKGAKKGFERLSKAIVAQIQVFENGIDEDGKTVTMAPEEEREFRDEYVVLLRLLRRDLSGYIDSIEHEDQADFSEEEKELLKVAEAAHAKAVADLHTLSQTVRQLDTLRAGLKAELASNSSGSVAGDHEGTNSTERGFDAMCTIADAKKISSKELPPFSGNPADYRRWKHNILRSSEAMRVTETMLKEYMRHWGLPKVPSHLKDEVDHAPDMKAAWKLLDNVFGCCSASTVEVLQEIDALPKLNCPKDIETQAFKLSMIIRALEQMDAAGPADGKKMSEKLLTKDVMTRALRNIDITWHWQINAAMKLRDTHEQIDTLKVVRDISMDHVETYRMWYDPIWGMACPIKQPTKPPTTQQQVAVKQVVTQPTSSAPKKQEATKANSHKECVACGSRNHTVFGKECQKNRGQAGESLARDVDQRGACTRCLQMKAACKRAQGGCAGTRYFKPGNKYLSTDCTAADRCMYNKYPVNALICKHGPITRPQPPADTFQPSGEGSSAASQH